jgi:hypothetical protein
MWLAAFLVVSLAGCADSDDAPEQVAEDVAPDPTAPVFGPHSGLPLTRGADWVPRLDAAPEWVLGEWWTIEILDGFVGQSHTVTSVVAGKEGPDYLIGMPEPDFNDEVMILHHPGFGLVKSSTLGYETHDWMFEPLRFPLKQGDSWDSLWQSGTNTVTHTVEEVDDATMTAKIAMTGGQSAEYVYDAGLGFIRDFHAPGYMEFHVVAHGFGHEGVVRVPHGHDLIFLHGSLGPVPVGGETPILQTVSVPDAYDRTSFSLIIFELVPLLVAPAAPVTDLVGQGVYQIDVTAPDGATFSATKLPTEPGHKIVSFSHDQVGGDWTIQSVAAGPAQVFLEGIGYVTFDVSMPEGCVLKTSKVHDHGGDCGGHVHDIE